MITDEDTLALALATGRVANGVVELGRLALEFGLVKRATLHQDGVLHESDTTHTVMLGWVACAITDLWYPDLDSGLVAQFTLVHDMHEALCGDTNTLGATPRQLTAKRQREAAAGEELCARFERVLPWVPAMLRRYELQTEPEARLVRALDKSMPKITHLLNMCASITAQGMTAAQLAAFLERQHADIAAYAGDFSEVMALTGQLAGCVVAAMTEKEKEDTSEETGR
jgi:5'-deoxynucleotidase YfbR-like HD superfamily hydrolase